MLNHPADAHVCWTGFKKSPEAVDSKDERHSSERVSRFSNITCAGLNRSIVDGGMWFLKKLKNSTALHQFCFTDSKNPMTTFMYRLSEAPGLSFFKNVLLVASPQDGYAPFYSARVEVCNPNHTQISTAAALIIYKWIYEYTRIYVQVFSVLRMHLQTQLLMSVDHLDQTLKP